MNVSSDDARFGRPTLGPVLSNHRFDEQRLVCYLRQHLPDFAGDCTILQFQGGQSNPTFRVEAGGRAYVLRKQPPGTLLPSAHAVDREFTIMKALAGSTVPVPRMYLLCQDPSVIGQMFYVMEWVDGRVFTNPALAGLAPDERARLYDAMNETLAKLHRVDYASIGLGGFGRPEQFVTRQIARWSRQFVATGLKDSAAMERLMEWLPRQDPGAEEVAINHGDYRIGNLLFHPTESRVVAVLDWEISTLGHPIADLAYNCLVYHGLTMAGRSVAPDGCLVAGIPSEQTYVELYRERIGRPSIPRWSFFIAFALFRAASIMAGVYRRAHDGNAADAKALEVSSVYRELAERGWEIANRAPT
jgi:aminoglycoside phosphotransferase (APT) family kinase protein